MGKLSPVTVFFAALLTVAIALSSASAETEKTVKQTQGKLEKAVFAGGCFWCMEAPFDQLPGVVSGGTGHAEAVQIVYDPAKISYEKLLTVFWHNIDPTVKNRQFCDNGDQYRSAIFFNTEEQHSIAGKSRTALEKSKPFREPVVTEIVQAGEFYPAEDYHQHYYKKNPIRYKYYRNGCGRDQRLKELWGSAAGH